MKRITLGALTGLLAAATILPIFASAPVYAGSGKGMEISPLIVDQVRSPGDTFSSEITLRNLTDTAVVASAAIHNFTSEDDTGTPKIDVKDEQADSSFSMRSWVSAIPDVHMKKGEAVKIPVTFTIPANAEAGGHYGAILFTLAAETDTNGQTSQVALGASIGTLYLIRVTGSVVEKMTLDGFYTLNPKGDRSPMLDSGPISFVVRLKNDGTVHEKPEGNIAVTDMFGRKVGTVVVNDKGGSILPKSTRRYNQQLATKNLFGYYHAKLTLVYADGQKIQNNISFFVIPWQLIILVVLGLLIVLFLLRGWLRSYRASIIKQVRTNRK